MGISTGISLFFPMDRRQAVSAWLCVPGIGLREMWGWRDKPACMIEPYL